MLVCVSVGSNHCNNPNGYSLSLFTITYSRIKEDLIMINYMKNNGFGTFKDINDRCLPCGQYHANIR